MTWKIVINPTYRCANRCDYCDIEFKHAGREIKYYDGVRKIARELSAKEWVDGLMRLVNRDDAVIDICGGEPLLYHDIKALTSALPVWAITSSLQTDIDIDLQHCISFTASFHYYNFDKFCERFDSLDISNKSITLVAAPWNIQECRKAFLDFTELGFGVNVQVFLRRGFTWPEVDKAQLSWLLQNNVSNFAGRLFTWQELKFNTCLAGKEYCFIHPDGQIDRCQSWFTDNKPVIGHLLSDPQIDTSQQWFTDNKCDIFCQYPCDYQRSAKNI